MLTGKPQPASQACLTTALGYRDAMTGNFTNALLLGCTALWAAPVAAETRAIVIGVSDYLVLDADLKGPSHDAQLMAETLLGRGVAAGAIRVLASDPPDLPEGVTNTVPTKAAITAAMVAVAAESEPGDTVVFYFSGHGSQAPDASGDEGGGYDEILLPADAAGWKGAIGAVENALLDDELYAWAQELTGRGVQLVGLIDACHSATGFRALGGEGQAKTLEPEVLGIPEASGGPSEVVPVAPLQGDYVFLYSSQSDERSFEYPLGETGIWHGEFTLRLADVLSTAPEASWAQVLAATTEAMAQGPARQMPEGEGPLLEAQVFGAGAAAGRYRLQEGRVAAGLLQGLEPGAELTLYAEGAGGEALGTVTVAEAEARVSRLEGDLPAGAAWAERTAAAPVQPLALAAPVFANPLDGFDYTPWIDALPGPGAKPDLVPILTEGTVALADASGVLDPEGPGSSPRIQPEPGESPAEAVTRVLEAAAHGLRLRQTLSGAAAGRALTGGAVVEMAVERRAGAPAEGGACGTAAPGAAADPAKGVGACDELWLTLTNRSGKAQDVSVLYFASDFTVAPIWPVQNMINRLAPGESVTVGLQIAASASAGLEEIWVLAVPESDQGGRVDLTRLASPELTRAFASASDPMSLWLEGRMLPPDETKTRGFSRKPAPLTMIRQLVRVTPITE
ncbi:caspase family protein [Xinfangfangia sp. CPCC 101601]|uniref:Caspase family protein n=1 Tax=Pseudogemmobacter lacusdianii TaxID=3069608 RepID=A0ABU0VW33_9RHOB|nr:caspase family protein [Xinfangfangia sp. CPCC 101601]MDQ2065966.1 caspase family protein [Xinfangfangia sp. CPCC 101601]